MNRWHVVMNGTLTTPYSADGAVREVVKQCLIGARAWPEGFLTELLEDMTIALIKPDSDDVHKEQSRIDPDRLCANAFCGRPRRDHWGPHPLVEGICGGFKS